MMIIHLRPAMLFAFLKALPLICAGYYLPAAGLVALPLFYCIQPGAVCGFAWYRLLYIRSFKYQVTAEYILITKGIFFKRIDQVEMFRVKDYIITQSFIYANMQADAFHLKKYRRRKLRHPVPGNT
jgi:uncharacterized membrane protein YdbT with pleckstrin-like domain